MSECDEIAVLKLKLANLEEIKALKGRIQSYTNADDAANPSALRQTNLSAAPVNLNSDDHVFDLTRVRTEEPEVVLPTLLAAEEEEVLPVLVQEPPAVEPPSLKFPTAYQAKKLSESFVEQNTPTLASFLKSKVNPTKLNVISALEGQAIKITSVQLSEETRDRVPNPNTLKRKANLVDVEGEPAQLKMSHLLKIKKRGDLKTEKDCAAIINENIPANSQHEYEWSCVENEKDPFGYNMGTFHCRLCFIAVSCYNMKSKSDNWHHATKKHKEAQASAERSNVLQTSIKKMADKAVKSGELSARVTQVAHEYRLQCLRIFMQCGIPFTVLTTDTMRNFLEQRGGVKLTDSSNLARDYLPILNTERIDKLKILLKGRRLVVIFDSTPIKHNFHAFNFGFVDENTNLIILNGNLTMFLPGSPNEKIGKQLSSILLSDFMKLEIECSQVRYTFLPYY